MRQQLKRRTFEAYCPEISQTLFPARFLKLAPPQAYASYNILTVAQDERGNPGILSCAAEYSLDPACDRHIDMNYSIPRNGHQWSFRIDNYSAK